tara:strand:- start:1901 stop:2926 length:1026 start_codon:yes stop_codon:yes gene_type:complete
MTNTATDDDTGTEVITIPHKNDVPALFSKKDGIEKLVRQIEKQARAVVIDHSTAKGRKEVKSLAAKVSRSKTLIDEVGKEQNEERNRQNKEVNALRNLAKERLDTLRDEIKAPVEAWEQAEAERVRQHMIKMDTFDLERTTGHDSSDTIQGVIDTIKAAKVDEAWEEYEADAKAAKAAALVKYEGDLGIAKAREAQEAELEALRAEKVQRDQEASQRAIAEQKAKDEAAEKARVEAMAQARADEAAAQAKADAEAAEARHQQELGAAKEREERAAQAERNRIAAEQKAEEDAANARAADKKHRQKIRAEVVKSITDANPGNWEELVDMMLVGEIAHVKVMI